MVLLSVFTGKFYDKYGPRPLIYTGFTILAITTMMLCFLHTDTSYTYLIVVYQLECFQAFTHDADKYYRNLVLCEIKKSHITRPKFIIAVPCEISSFLKELIPVVFIGIMSKETENILIAYTTIKYV